MFFQDERRIGKIPFKKKFMEVFIRVREHNPAHVHIKFEGKEGELQNIGWRMDGRKRIHGEGKAEN